MLRRTRLALTVAAALAATVILSAADYTLTVSQDRLNNAINEPQNWLLMNGNYGSTRFSKLTQINRDNVQNLRMVWAMALGGMQDVGAERARERGQPPHRQRLHVHDRRLGHDLQDRRARRATRASSCGRPTSASSTRATRRAPAASRSGRTGSSPTCPTAASSPSTATPARSSGTSRSPSAASSAGMERFYTAPMVADGKVIIQNGAGDAGTRGWLAALDVKTGEELWRFYTVPEPGEPGSETWKDDHSAWKTGGGGIWQTGSYDPEQHLYIVGTGNPYPIYDPQFRPGDNLYTNSVIALNVDTGKLAWYFQYTPNDSWDFDEVGVHMLYDTEIDGVMRKVVGHFGRNGFYYTLDRTNGHFIQLGEVRQRPELDAGASTRRRASRSSTTRSSTCSCTTPRRGRCAATG